MCKVDAMCPFCGENKVNVFPSNKYYIVKCFACETGIVATNKEDAIERWNNMCAYIFFEALVSRIAKTITFSKMSKTSMSTTTIDEIFNELDGKVYMGDNK
jgi:hypothetical protein